MTIEELAVAPSALVAENEAEQNLLFDLLLDECERRTGWRGVQDASSADWAARKILEAERELADLKAQTKERIKAAESELTRRRAFFEPQIRAWFEAQDLKGKKSIALASVTLAARSVAGGFKFTDKAAALEWAQANKPEAVSERIVHDLDEDALKRAAQADGESIPGLEFVEPHESFSIKAPKAKGEG